MIVFKQSTNKIIEVEDDFARLIDITDNDDVTFEVVFTVSKSKALQAQLMSVDVDVYSQVMKRPNKLDFKSNTEFIDGILRRSQDTTNSLTNVNRSIVAHATSDITAFINNDNISAITSGVKQKKLKIKPVLKKDLTKNSDVIPTFQQLAYKSFSDIQQAVSSSIDTDIIKLSRQLLSLGIEPAQITELDHRSIAAFSSLQGLLRKTRASSQVSNVFSEKLLDYHILGATALTTETNSNQVQNDEYVLTKIHVDDDKITIPVQFTISAKNTQKNPREVLQYHVVFKGKNVEEVTKVLDVQKYISAFLYPDAKPLVKLTCTNKKAVLEITQVSDRADSVILLKKTLPNDYNTVFSFDDLGKYSLAPGKSLKLYFELPQNDIEIYRIFAATGENVLSEFVSAAVVANKVSQKNLIVVPKNSEKSVEIELRNIPAEVLTIQVLVKNLTIFETDYTAVQDPIFITDAIRIADNLTVVDYSAKKNSIYEYVVDMIYQNGKIIRTSPAIIKFLGTTAGTTTTSISNVVISSENSLDVSFDVKSVLFPNNADNTLAFLKSSGIYDLYQLDISGSRDALSGLIAHSIERINKTTGLRENFGLISSSSFSDASLSQNASVLPLALGHSYRYEIFANLRVTEQLITDFIKSKTDQRTKKNYKFVLQKFSHPIVSNEGMLVTSQGLQLMYPQSEMEHGNLGLAAVFEASFEHVNATVTNVTAVKLDRFKNIVSWRVQGNISTIDHFLIFKQVHNIRTLLAAVHPFVEIENYGHNLSDKDLGPISYVIVPVYQDYSVGNGVKSNSLVVDNI